MIPQGGPLAQELQERLDLFLLPLLIVLDAHLDARTIRTVVRTVRVVICWRHHAHGRLLSELGAYLLSPTQAPAGTKRLSNLLRSPKWAAGLIEQVLWQRADARLATLEADGGGRVRHVGRARAGEAGEPRGRGFVPGPL